MSLAGTVQGSGEPTLFLHGLGLCWQTWAPLFPHLSGLEIHAVDLPGFGASAPLDGDVTVDALLDAVEAHLDEIGLDRVHVVGNSLGGLLAAGLAGRRRALSVTALSPGGLAEGWARHWVRNTLLLSHVLARRGQHLAGPLLQSRVGRHLTLRLETAARPGDMTPEHAETIVQAFGTAPAVRATLDALEGPGGRLLPHLADVAVPVTVAWGSRDLLLFPRQGLRIKREHPWVRLVRLPGSGHVPMTDAPDVVAHVIRATVASAVAAGRRGQI